MVTIEQLDVLQAAAEAAVELADGAEWFSEVDLHLTAGFEDADVAFIAAANPAVVLELVAAHRAALARIARVEALHEKVPARYYGTDLNPSREFDCRVCGEGRPYPCATVRALTEEEPSE